MRTGASTWRRQVHRDGTPKLGRMQEVSIRDRLPRDVVWIVGIACVVHAAMIVAYSGFGYDSHAYWITGQGGELYGRRPNTKDAFLYSPAFAQLLWPLAQLPWPVFAVLFVVLPAAAFVWLLRPLPWRWGVPLWLATMPEIVTGNVFWLLALVAVGGLRFPAAWTFAALTKITPCLGPVWFLARREWRSASYAIGAILLVTAVSVSIDPGAWRDWVAFLRENLSRSGHAMGIPILPPLAVRFPVAVGLVFFAARTGRRQLIPVAMVIATPVLAIASFTILAAMPRLASAPGQGARRPAAGSDDGLVSLP